MASAQDPWSNIPLDVAELVLKRLPAHVDRVCFAAVCPQWRSAMRQIKLPPPMPLLALKDGDIFYSMPRGEPLRVAGYKNGHLSDGCRKAFYQGKLYVLGYHEDLSALDISLDDNTGDPWVSLIGRVINVNQFDNERTLLRMLYLVESTGSLLLVRRRLFHTKVHGEGQIHTFAGQCEPDVSIFEADFARSQWVKMTTLPDDQALFLGPCSRAVGMLLGDSPGNRMWFLDDYKDFHSWNQYCHSSSLSSDNSSMANPKLFSPLLMISWRGCVGNAGAAWLFPAN